MVGVIPTVVIVDPFDWFFMQPPDDQDPVPVHLFGLSSCQWWYLAMSAQLTSSRSLRHQDDTTSAEITNPSQVLNTIALVTEVWTPFPFCSLCVSLGQGLVEPAHHSLRTPTVCLSMFDLLIFLIFLFRTGCCSVESPATERGRNITIKDQHCSVVLL